MTSLVCSTMSIAMDDIHDMDISGYSTITITNNTNTPSSDECNRNHWSPIVNWDAFIGGQDHFHVLIESMFDEDNPPMVALSPDNHGSNSAFTTEDPASCTVDADEVDDFKGLRLVHLLMAAAEALTCVNKSRDLARVILVRLKECTNIL